MDYMYYGLELTPTVFEDLLIRFFDGKQFKRQDAIDKIMSFLGDEYEFVMLYSRNQIIDRFRRRKDHF